MQERISNNRAEIRVHTCISTSKKVKYNKPDVFLLVNENKEIFIVEMGITISDNLRAVEIENEQKVDMLANHYGFLDEYMSRIIPYVMT